MDDHACTRCAKAGGTIVLIRCPICHKQVCEECRVQRSGRSFCSHYCAESFFFGDEEE